MPSDLYRIRITVCIAGGIARVRDANSSRNRGTGTGQFPSYVNQLRVPMNDLDCDPKELMRFLWSTSPEIDAPLDLNNAPVFPLTKMASSDFHGLPEGAVIAVEINDERNTSGEVAADSSVSADELPFEWCRVAVKGQDEPSRCALKGTPLLVRTRQGGQPLAPDDKLRAVVVLNTEADHSLAFREACGPFAEDSEIYVLRHASQADVIEEVCRVRANSLVFASHHDHADGGLDFFDDDGSQRPESVTADHFFRELRKELGADAQLLRLVALLGCSTWRSAGRLLVGGTSAAETTFDDWSIPAVLATHMHIDTKDACKLAGRLVASLFKSGDVTESYRELRNACHTEGDHGLRLAASLVLHLNGVPEGSTELPSRLVTNDATVAARIRFVRRQSFKYLKVESPLGDEGVRRDKGGYIQRTLETTVTEEHRDIGGPPGTAP